MKFDSQFFLAGASVLAVLFFVHGDWALLIVPILLMIAGIARHDLERARELDEDCARQLLDRPGTAMLPLAGFRGRGLMFYHGGQPAVLTAAVSGGHPARSPADADQRFHPFQP